MKDHTGGFFFARTRPTRGRGGSRGRVLLLGTNFRYWRDPRYWRWRWTGVSGGAKTLLAVGLALLAGAAGYWTARTASDMTKTATYTPPSTPRLVTVKQTITDMRGRSVTARVPKTVTLQGASASAGSFKRRRSRR